MGCQSNWKEAVSLIKECNVLFNGKCPDIESSSDWMMKNYEKHLQMDTFRGITHLYSCVLSFYCSERTTINVLRIHCSFSFRLLERYINIFLKGNLNRKFYVSFDWLSFSVAFWIYFYKFVIYSHTQILKCLLHKTE